jgi:hypothetical protein
MVGGETYDLRDTVHWRLAFLVVRFQPKDKSRERLGSKRLYSKDQCEEKGLPAGEEACNRLHGVWFTLGFATSFLHAGSGYLDILLVCQTDTLHLIIQTYLLCEDPVRLRGSWSIRKEEVC